MWAIVYEKFAICNFLSLGDLSFLNKMYTVRAFDAAVNTLGEAATLVYGRPDTDRLVPV